MKDKESYWVVNLAHTFLIFNEKKKKMNEITYSFFILQPEYPHLVKILIFSVHFCEYLKSFKMHLAPQKNIWMSSEAGSWILSSWK